MEDCVKLLQGSNDEQRLVGLLLATKIVAGDDLQAVRKVFDAIGFPFLKRLLKTGTGKAKKGTAAAAAAAAGLQQEKEQQRAYLNLALSIIAAFCRVPELAARDDTIGIVPILVETLASKDEEKKDDDDDDATAAAAAAAVADCFECLLAIGSASEKGLEAIHGHSVLMIVASQLRDAPPTAMWIPIGVRLLEFMLATVNSEEDLAKCSQYLVGVIPVVARQLVSRQDILKFEALSLLHRLLASQFSDFMQIAVQKAPPFDVDWADQVRSGLGLVLHNRVDVKFKQLALELAEALVQLIGDSWLVGTMKIPDEQRCVPSDRFFLLILETLRVETAVLLNEVARIVFDNSGGTLVAQNPEAAMKQRQLATFFFLLEHIMNVVAEQQDAGGNLGELAMEKAIVALDEVVGVILEFLEDAHEHGIARGDMLLAAARLVGRYLAEAPSAHHNRVLKLLGFLLSVTNEGQDSAIQAVVFFLPALSQLTTEVDGCKALVECEGHKQIVEFAQAAAQTGGPGFQGPIVDSCDSLLNLLNKKDVLRGLNVVDFIPALPALAAWALQGQPVMECALVASLCTIVLGLTSENQLSHFLAPSDMQSIFSVILINLERCQRAERLEEPAEEEDLWDITVSGCAACMQQYPSLRHMIRSSTWLDCFLGKRPVTATLEEVTANPSLQMLLASIFTN
jgi:hypothetical protein